VRVRVKPPHWDKAFTSFREYSGASAKQWEFCQALVRKRTSRVLCGGAGGGGKSKGMRMGSVYACMTLFTHGIRSPRWGMFRNTYDDLKDNHAAALVDEWGDWGEFKTDKLYGVCFKFHDRRLGFIPFRNMDESKDRKGNRIHGACIDELTETSQKSFGKVAYQCSEPAPFNSIGAGTNPDGPYYSWVMEEFKADESPVGWWRDSDGLWHNYIPFLPWDNPAWHLFKDAFMAGIKHLPEQVRRARLQGIWGAPEGARFPQFDKRVHLFKLEDLAWGIQPEWHRGLGIDYGIRNPFACVKLAYDDKAKRLYLYHERYGVKGTYAQADEIVASLMDGEVMNWAKADPAMWSKAPDPAEREPVTPADIYKPIFEKDPRLACGLTKGRAILDRTHVFALWDWLLAPREDGLPGLLIEEGCRSVIKEITMAVHPEKEMNRKIGDISVKSADHALTAVYYGIPRWIVDDMEQAKKKTQEEQLRDERRRAAAEKLGWLRR
jgi:hypothetical protein